MSFETKLFEALKSESESHLVRNAALAGKSALIDRHDALSEAHRIAHANDPSVTDDIRAAGKRHALGKAMEKVNAAMAKIAAAEEDVARRLPAITQPETAGGAQVDAELRQHWKTLPEQQRATFVGLSDAMKLALARAPAELSSMSTNVHARLADDVRRKLYPAAMAKLDADRAVLAAARDAVHALRETARSNFGTPIETSATKVVAA